MKTILTGILTLYTLISFSQGNCLLYPEGSNERKACRLAETTGELKQGSRESQQRFDSIIALNPNYAWAYFEKSVAYLKRGLLLEGLKNLDKAVELDPKSHILGMLYVKNKDYKKALETFKKQLEITEDFPESYYYQALAYKELSEIELAKVSLEKALIKFQDPSHMENGYYCFKVYPRDVEKMLKELNL